MKNFTIGISTTAFTTKPIRFDNSIKYNKRNINIEQLADLIKEGRVLTHNFIGTFDDDFCKTDITIANFDYTYLVLLDIDDCALNMNDFLSLLPLKPSLAYTTSSNIDNVSNRFRLAYLFNGPIKTNDEYKAIAKNIIGYINKNIIGYVHKDNTCINASQVMYGNPNSDISIIYNEATYNVNDFANPSVLGKEGIHYTDGNAKNTNEHKEHKELIKTIIIKDQEFIDNLFSINSSDSCNAFIDKYSIKYGYFDKTPLEGFNNPDIPFVKLPENYVEIKRYVYKDYVEKEDGEKKYTNRVLRIKKGNRNKLLYVASLLRKQMITNVTFEHLLYCLFIDRYYFVDNSDKEITLKKLFVIARNAYNTNYTINIEKNKRQYIVNPLYCATHNIKAKSINNWIKKEIINEQIGELFDFELSVKENLQIMKNNNIKVSQRKLYDFLNEYKNNIDNIDNTNTDTTNNFAFPFVLEKKGIHYTDGFAKSSNEVLYENFMADQNIIGTKRIQEPITIKYLIENEEDDYDFADFGGTYDIISKTNRIQYLNH